MIDAQLGRLFSTLLSWCTFYFEIWHYFVHIISTQVENTCAVCLLLSRINRDTVAGRGTALQSHAPRQLQTHACTHTRTTAEQLSWCADQGCSKTLTCIRRQTYFSADVRLVFWRWQLKSACLSVDFGGKPLSCVCTCAHMPNTYVCAAIQQVTWAGNLSRSIINIYDTCWLFSHKIQRLDKNFE